MAQVSHDFTGTGTSAEFTVNGDSAVMYHADYTTGSGAGTVQLQVNIAGDWLPAAAAITGDMTALGIIDAPGTELRRFRWNCSVHSSGTITVYLG